MWTLVLFIPIILFLLAELIAMILFLARRDWETVQNQRMYQPT